jgi:hypothetical protein
MSELLKRYEDSNKPRPSQAKQIPNLAVNMFDTTDKFQKGFVTFEKRGDPTKFTTVALDYFNTEYKEIIVPDNFVPTDEGITLSRWNPNNKYYNTGQGA